MQLEPIVLRSPRTTRAQRQEWLQKFFTSGLSRQAFAQEHGLKLSTLCRWLAQAQEGDNAPCLPKPVVFKEVSLPAVVNASGQCWAMEIVTPSGLVLRLR